MDLRSTCPFPHPFFLLVLPHVLLREIPPLTGPTDVVYP
jgi:hypothetical protein